MAVVNEASVLKSQSSAFIFKRCLIILHCLSQYAAGNLVNFRRNPLNNEIKQMKSSCNILNNPDAHI